VQSVGKRAGNAKNYDPEAGGMMAVGGGVVDGQGRYMRRHQRSLPINWKDKFALKSG